MGSRPAPAPVTYIPEPIAPTVFQSVVPEEDFKRATEYIQDLKTERETAKAERYAEIGTPEEIRSRMDKRNKVTEAAYESSLPQPEIDYTTGLDPARLNNLDNFLNKNVGKEKVKLLHLFLHLKLIVLLQFVKLFKHLHLKLRRVQRLLLHLLQHLLRRLLPLPLLNQRLHQHLLSITVLQNLALENTDLNQIGIKPERVCHLKHPLVTLGLVMIVQIIEATGMKQQLSSNLKIRPSLINYLTSSSMG
jgi:hypothetical protein